MSARRRPKRGPGGRPLLDAHGQPILEETYTLYFRFQGKQRTLQTHVTTKEAAQKLERKIKAELKGNRIQNLIGELQSRHSRTVGQVIDRFIEAGCPGHDLTAKTGRPLARERAKLETARKWWGTKLPESITEADHDNYWAWRRSNVTRGTGDRTTELELQSLANAFTWAIRNRETIVNPFEKRRTYRSAGSVKHASERMPATTGEVHAIAAWLLSTKRSQVHGYAWLLACLTGLRCIELRGLTVRIPRVPGETPPGWADDHFLYVARAKGGKNPRIRLDDPERPHLGPLLQKIRLWQAQAYPYSSWLLAGKGGAQLSPDSLTRAIGAACRALGLPGRTAHGARAYYATVRWAQGIEPDQIAHELGQRSGEDLVREVYGGSPPAWDGLLNQKEWVPKAPARPAWEAPEGPRNVVAL